MKQKEIKINNKIFRQYIHENKILTNYYCDNEGNIYSLKNNKMLKPSKTLKGYHKVTIYLTPNNSKPVTVHKIIATTWCGGWHKGLDIDHINGIKTDNRAENLEWVTRSVNIKRAFDNDLKHAVRGDKHPVTVYSDSLVDKACSLIKYDNYTIKEASEETGIPYYYLCDMIKYHIRKDIIDKYNFGEEIYCVKKYNITDDDKRKIIQLYKDGYTAKEINKKLKIGSINVIYNQIYKHDAKRYTKKRKDKSSTTIESDDMYNINIGPQVEYIQVDGNGEYLNKDNDIV